MFCCRFFGWLVWFVEWCICWMCVVIWCYGVLCYFIFGWYWVDSLVYWLLLLVEFWMCCIVVWNVLFFLCFWSLGSCLGVVGCWLVYLLCDLIVDLVWLLLMVFNWFGICWMVCLYWGLLLWLDVCCRYVVRILVVVCGCWCYWFWFCCDWNVFVGRIIWLIGVYGCRCWVCCWWWCGIFWIFCGGFLVYWVRLCWCFCWWCCVLCWVWWWIFGFLVLWWWCWLMLVCRWCCWWWNWWLLRFVGCSWMCGLWFWIFGLLCVVFVYF